MENIEHCAVLVRRQKDVWESTRAALGLAVENLYSYLFVLDLEMEFTDELKENLEWLDDMECETYSNVRANAANEFVKYITNEEMVAKLLEMDLVIPFGARA